VQSPLLKKVFSLRNLEAAWRVIHDNARTSKSVTVRLEIEKFADDASHKLRSLAVRLRQGRFRFEAAKGIPIPKTDEHGRKTGKFRPIVLAPVESRIAQRALLNVLLEVPSLQCYIQTPYSFGGLRKPKGGSSERNGDLAAVPAAIKAVLAEVESGARFVACADIRSFFTRIPKSAVTSIISSAVRDAEFIPFFERAIHVELSNMAELRDRAGDFPIEDIGVAQGNSLSPLLGNIVLADFDEAMNDADCRCFRYIDDFIILAPSERAANARLRKAASLLENMEMELSPEKSSKKAISIRQGFEFLGIAVTPGLIRPSVKAQKKFLAAIEGEFLESRKAFNEVGDGKALNRTRSLITTLKRVDGMIDGWGKHYWFCNDGRVFEHLDLKITDQVRAYLGAYTGIRSRLGQEHYRSLMGVSELAAMNRVPFNYPKSLISERPRNSITRDGDVLVAQS
jgi:RNA-directed DNA polymerase